MLAIVVKTGVKEDGQWVGVGVQSGALQGPAAHGPYTPVGPSKGRLAGRFDAFGRPFGGRCGACNASHRGSRSFIKLLDKRVRCKAT